MGHGSPSTRTYTHTPPYACHDHDSDSGPNCSTDDDKRWQLFRVALCPTHLPQLLAWHYSTAPTYPPPADDYDSDSGSDCSSDDCEEAGTDASQVGAPVSDLLLLHHHLVHLRL